MPHNCRIMLYNTCIPPGFRHVNPTTQIQILFGLFNHGQHFNNCDLPLHFDTILVGNPQITIRVILKYAIQTLIYATIFNLIAAVL
jgi:hypothetical protein